MNKSADTGTSKIKLAKFILFLAAVYNMIWGSVVSLYPDFMVFAETPTFYTSILIKCIGMIVGLYGVGYYFASINPVKYWPLIFIGLLGKILGPIGSVYYIFTGQLDKSFFITNIFNDIIWLIPFSWILLMVYKKQLYHKHTPVNNNTLYREFLGEDFHKMSPELMKFHGSRKVIRVKGSFKVVRGTSLVSNILARIADLPGNAEVTDVELVVKPSEKYEIWHRRIDDKTVVSKQWLEDGFLVERFKGMNIYLDARVENGNLEISDVYSTIIGISMPGFLTPVVYATGAESDGQIEINVDIGFKPFGRIINYFGKVKIVEQNIVEEPEVVA